MAISPQVAAMIVKEHRHRPIDGDILLIGRQTVMMTAGEAIALIRREGVTVIGDFLDESDSKTVGADGKYITDRAFFSMFSTGRVMALDVSAYEGAEIIHDLNHELPREYTGIADFIFNGSCLDNLFDPARAIKSLSTMLRANGRMMDFEHGTPIQSAFLCFPPEWFFDFFAINDYADCQIFLCSFTRMQHAWRVFRWRPFYEDRGRVEIAPSTTDGDFVTFVIAEKGATSTNNRTPIQSHYRGFHEDVTRDAYIAKFRQYEASAREYSFTRRNHEDLGILEATC